MADDEQQESIDPFALFSEKIRTPVEGLMFLGQCTDEFEFAGHRFVVRTLLPHEKFAIGQAIQPYRNTLVEPDAFRTAHVSLALTEVDGRQDFCPIADRDLVDAVRARMNYVAKRWFDPVHDYLYTRYKLLELKAAQAIDEFDRLSRGSQHNKSSPPSLDSLTDPGGSVDETSMDTPPFTPSS